MRRCPISGKSGKWCLFITWKWNVKSDLRTKCKITCLNFVWSQIFWWETSDPTKMCNDGEKSWLKSVETLVRPLWLAAGSGAEAPLLAARPELGIYMFVDGHSAISRILGGACLGLPFISMPPSMGLDTCNTLPLQAFCRQILSFSCTSSPFPRHWIFSCFCFPFSTIFLSLISFLG